VNVVSDHTLKPVSLQKCPHWWETLALDIGNWEKWITSCFSTSSTKGVALLLSSAYTEQDVPTLQFFHVSQLKKLYEGAVEPSSIEWSHWSQIVLSATSNWVIDRSDHTIGHKMGRLYKLHQRLREFSYQSSWLSILLVKHFVISVPCFLAAPLFSNLRTRFLLKGEGCNTPCYETRNYLH
jgi:hypothetical protein